MPLMHDKPNTRVEYWKDIVNKLVVYIDITMLVMNCKILLWNYSKNKWAHLTFKEKLHSLKKKFDYGEFNVKGLVI